MANNKTDDNSIHSAIRETVKKFGLTQREAQIVELLAMGYDTKALAKQLFISPATIRTHLRNIFSALGVNSRAKLISVIMRSVLANHNNNKFDIQTSHEENDDSENADDEIKSKKKRADISAS